MAQEKQTQSPAGTGGAQPQKQAATDAERIPKPESSAEFEGAAARKSADQAATDIKTETSSSSGQ